MTESERMHILVGNLPPDITVEDIQDALADLDFDIEVTLSPGDRTTAQITFAGMTRTAAEGLAEQINGRFWRERTLQAYVPLFFK
jgi:hypothetical protein